MKKLSPNTYLLLFTAACLSLVESYRILGVFPLNGKSHDLMFSALVKSLTKRNHEVDVITYFPLNDPPPNYKVVVNLNDGKSSKFSTIGFDVIKELSRDFTYYAANTFGNDICKLLSLEKMQNFIKHPPKYDLVIVELFGANCFLGFGHLFKVPIIAVSSTVEYPWVSDIIGNADNLAYVPSTSLTEFDKTKFWDRLRNVFSYYYNVYRFYSYTEKIQTDLMRQYLSPDMPSVREIEKSIALTIINKHHVIYGGHTMSASVIHVSMLHIMDKIELKLPLDLKKWLDESTAGVVYFTFGTMVLIESLPVDTLAAIYKSIEKIAPVRVLLKIVNKEKLPPGLPKNVLMSAWMPQQAVLAHKNVRVFLTHGGLMSTQEALYYGLPIIGVPLFADQARNIRILVEKNMATQIKFNNITTESLDEAFDLVLNNPIYRENAKFYSTAFKDRPMEAIDTATYWIEYIARNGPSILKSPALDMKWWQIALLDVYGFILLCIIVTLLSTYSLKMLIIKQILRLKHKNIKLE